MAADRLRTTVIATVVAVVLLVVLGTAGVVRADLERHREQVRASTHARASALVAAVEQVMAAHEAITESVGALVEPDGSVDTLAFRKLARRLLGIRDGIRALELAPDGVITYVHPVIGNQSAIGLDLNTHPSGAAAMERLRAGARILVEGPTELAQGGRAVILRSRVMVPGRSPVEPDEFWGVAINVLDLEPLLDETGLADAAGLRLELRRGDGTVALNDLILGEDVGDAEPLTFDIRLPGGAWTLAAVPADGWPTTSPNTLALLGAGLALAVALALLTSRFVSEPVRLRARVAQATADAERSHRQTAAIMNSVADAILAVDDVGRVVGWNPAACRLLRVLPEELRDSRVQKHLHVDRVPLQPDATGHRLGRRTMHVMRADGSTFPAEVSVAATDGESLRTISIRDVTEVQRRQSDLQRHVLELERLRQEHHAIDAVKRDFMSMASHEVRTPITAIRGFALTLNRHWDQLSDEDRRRSLDVIHRQATRLWHVVSDVLTTSQLEGGALDADIEPVHLRTTIERAVSDAQVPTTAVDIDCAPGLTARLDQGHLNRILVALLTNAHKYGAPPFEIRVSVDGGDLVVRVIDHGQGVPHAFRDQLFEPFSQASTGVTREAIGTGLGLSVARGLARASGGDVWHEDRGDAGAVFAVRIPRAVERHTEPPLEPPLPTALPVIEPTISPSVPSSRS